MPQSNATKRPVISYTPTRGRAETIRLILEEVEIKYDERAVTSLTEWLRLKPTLPFLQLPTYEDADVFIVQSHAIYRHLARIHGLYGQTESEHIDCDATEEAIRDAQQELWWFVNGLFPEKDPQKFADINLSSRLERLQRFLDRNSRDAQFWVSGSLTFVDLLAFAYLDDLRVLFPSTLSNFGQLTEFQERIAARPRIKEYLISSRRPAALYIGPDGLPFLDPSSKNPAPPRFWG